jgi:hypothetical protein
VRLSKFKGSLADLEIDIAKPAKSFGWAADDLALVLASIAIDYTDALSEYEQSPTRGVTLRALLDVQQRPDDTIAVGVQLLGPDAIQAIVGRFPNGITRIARVDGQGPSMWLPDDVEIMSAALQSQTALLSQSKQASLIGIFPATTGFERMVFHDDDQPREYLVDLASRAPDQLRQAIESTVARLTEMFQLSDLPGGRNIKLLDGSRPSPGWLLMREVVNKVWPIGRGRIHSSRMEDVRSLVNAVIVFSVGEENKKHGKGTHKRYRGVISDQDNGLLFDDALLSQVLTLRSQIDVLNQTLHWIESRRTFLLHQDGPRALQRWLRIQRLASDPLADWRRELERRLKFGDYRPWNAKIRRWTGPVLRIPNMPTINRKMSRARIALTLIRAARPLAAPE